MKNKALLLLLLFTATSISAQDCSKFYSFSEGTSGQITNYEGNGKVSTIMDYTIKDVKSVGGVQTATMSAKVKDKKGKHIIESDYKFSCDGKIVAMDFNSLLNQKMFEQFKDMETQITGENLMFPNDLSVGQSLPDSSVNVKISMSGINMDMNTNITNRKVVGKESITTPAGTFNCYVITYVNSFVMTGFNQQSEGKQWIAEGVGMVKQEDYNKKGKVTSSSMLTAFSK